MNLEELSGIGLLAKGPGTAAEVPAWLRDFPRLAVVTGAGLEERGGPALALLRKVQTAGPACAVLPLRGEPSDLWVDDARRRLGTADAVLSIGGGSVLDAGKALAVMLCEQGPTQDLLEGVGTRAPLGKMRPWFAVPTTAGTGSEASSNAVLSRPGLQGFKKSLRHPNFRATGVALDGGLCQGASPLLTAACGMDAFTQLLESYLSLRLTPALEPWLKQALIAAYTTLPLAVQGAPHAAIEARQTLLEATFVSGIGLSRAGLGTVHGLAGPAGACSPVPHGLACARFFGPCLRETRSWLTAQQVEPALGRLRALEAAGIVLEELEHWGDRFGLPLLRDRGIGAAEQAFILQAASDRDSPARLGPECWRRILDEAVNGAGL